MKKVKHAGEELADEIKSLLKERNPVEDASGRTPLDILADELASLPPKSTVKKKYGWALSQLARHLPHFNIDQTKNLCLFIESAEIPSDSYSEAFREQLRSGLQSKSEIEKRAEILRLLAEQGQKFIPRQLVDEVQVRKMFPWHWIDAMEPIDWPAAEKAITDTLSAEKCARNLLNRRAFLWEKHDTLKESIHTWLSILHGSERQKLVDWMDHRGIRLGDREDNPQRTMSFGGKYDCITQGDKDFAQRAVKRSLIPLAISKLVR